MAAFQLDFRQFRQIAQYRQTRFAFQQVFIIGIHSASDTIQQNTADEIWRAKCLKTAADRSCGTAHSLGRKHQQRRRLKPVRYSIGTRLRGALYAVVVTHCALQDRAVRICTDTSNQLCHSILRQKKRVCVICLPPGNMTVKHGIDIVRPAFQALDTKAAVAKRCKKCRGNRCLSSTAAGCTDQQPRNRSLHLKKLLSQK